MRTPCGDGYRFFSCRTQTPRRCPGSTLTGSAHPAIRLAPRISRVGVTSAEVPIWAGCLCSLMGASSRVWMGNPLRG